MSDTDARLWHPWLRINRVLRVMLHTRWSAAAWLRALERLLPDRADARHVFAARRRPARRWSEITPEPIAVTFSCTLELAQRLLDIARTSCPDVATGIRAANRPTDALGRRDACSALAYIRCGSGVGWQRL